MKPGLYRRLAYAAWMALWLAAAAGIVAIAWPMQIERGCWLGEWPFEDGCPDYPTSKNPEAPAQAGDKAEDSRRRYYRLSPLGDAVLRAEAQRLEGLISDARRKHVLSDTSGV